MFNFYAKLFSWKYAQLKNVKAAPFYFLSKALQMPKRLFYQGNRFTLVHIWYTLLYSIGFKLNLRL